MSTEQNDASGSVQARIKRLMALGDIQAVLDLVAGLETHSDAEAARADAETCILYTSPSPRD